jgi:hypothetical protein
MKYRSDIMELTAMTFMNLDSTRRATMMAVRKEIWPMSRPDALDVRDEKTPEDQLANMDCSWIVPISIELLL